MAQTPTLNTRPCSWLQVGAARKNEGWDEAESPAFSYPATQLNQDNTPDDNEAARKADETKAPDATEAQKQEARQKATRSPSIVSLVDPLTVTPNAAT